MKLRTLCGLIYSISLESYLRILENILPLQSNKCKRKHKNTNVFVYRYSSMKLRNTKNNDFFFSKSFNENASIPSELFRFAEEH